MYIIYYNIATIEIGISHFQKEMVNNFVFWIILYSFYLLFFLLYVIQFQMI